MTRMEEMHERREDLTKNQERVDYSKSISGDMKSNHNNQRGQRGIDAKSSRGVHGDEWNQEHGKQLQRTGVERALGGEKQQSGCAMGSSPGLESSQGLQRGSCWVSSGRDYHSALLIPGTPFDKQEECNGEAESRESSARLDAAIPSSTEAVAFTAMR